MMADYASKLSKLLPPSLGSLFGQPIERVEQRSTLPEPPRDLPGARAAPELCTIVDQYRPDLVREHAVAEVKLDGIRCLYIAGRLWTREGSPFEAAEHCLPVLQQVEAAFGVPMFFDGEYVEDGGLESTLAAFRRRKGDGCLWLFDAVPFTEWQSGRPSRQPLVDRKAKLRWKLLATTERREGVPVGFIEHLTLDGPVGVENAAQDLWAAGYEGLVVKDSRSLYLRKRTCDWMKVKLRTVSKMLVVDMGGCKRKVSFVDLDGYHEEWREAAKFLLVRMPAEGSRPIKIMVNGGLAETLWTRRGDVIGSFCEVEHAGFTGGGNPREAMLKSVTL